MQFTVIKHEFQKALASVQGVIDRRGTMPILGNVLLETNGNGLDVSATDLEVSYRGHCPAQISAEGAVTVPAVKLFALVKELQDGDVLDIKATENHNLVVKRDAARYTLHGLDPEQFPAFPAFDGDMFEMEARTLKDMISKVLYSTSTDDLAYHLSSVLLEREDGKPWRLVATDGHRLTLIDREGAQVSLATSILIPRKGAQEMVKFLDGEMVRIGLVNQLLHLVSGDRLLAIRLLDKKFPEYGRIIPEAFKISFAFNRQAMIDALRRLSILTSDRFKGMVFKLQAEQAEITFQNPDEGEGRETLPIIECAGDPSLLPIKTGYNARYLLEPLLAMTGERVLLEIVEPDRPAKLSDQGDPHYFSLVMPLGL